MRNILKWLSTITSAGMFFVLLAGALVTNTESGRGCGSDWPLCNGKFVPAYTIASLIEYSHRAITGLVGMLVLATAICVWIAARNRRGAVAFAGGALFFTILQAFLGAMAVIWPQSSPVLALHFGFSLLAFSSTLLLAIIFWRPGSDAARPQQSVSKSFRNKVWIVTIYSYIVVYIGAFVRHTESGGGCSGWPLCNGKLIPSLEGVTAIVFTHRMAALLLLVLIAWMAYGAERGYKHMLEIKNGSRWALSLVVMQILSGGLLVASARSDWYLLATMLHTVIIAALFGVLCYLSVRVMSQGSAVRDTR